MAAVSKTGDGLFRFHDAFIFLLVLAACSARVLPPAALVPDGPVPIGAVLAFTDGFTACSAVAIAPKQALTTAHCLRNRDRRWLVLADGALVPVIGHEVDGELAVLHVYSRLPVVAQVARRVPQPGDRAWLAGYGCRSDGWRLRLDVREARALNAVQYAGNACHGDSGGGVFDAGGRLVGVLVTRSAGEAQAVGASRRGTRLTFSKR